MCIIPEIQTYQVPDNLTQYVVGLPSTVSQRAAVTLTECLEERMGSIDYFTVLKLL